MKLPTYIINLKHRTDRYNHIVNEITKLELTQYEIVEAIKHDVLWKGCLASHLKCIQLAKQNKFPYVLILEDDAIFTEDASYILTETFNEIQNLRWDIFFLGANLQTQAERISNSILKLNSAFAAHAYIVQEHFYNVILNLPNTSEIDVHYNNLMSKYNIYMCDPMIAYQLPSYSDLQNGYRDYNQAIFNNYLKYKP